MGGKGKGQSLPDRYPDNDPDKDPDKLNRCGARSGDYSARKGQGIAELPVKNQLGQGIKRKPGRTLPHHLDRLI